MAQGERREGKGRGLRQEGPEPGSCGLAGAGGGGAGRSLLPRQPAAALGGGIAFNPFQEKGGSLRCGWTTRENGEGFKHSQGIGAEPGSRGEKEEFVKKHLKIAMNGGKSLVPEDALGYG